MLSRDLLSFASVLSIFVASNALAAPEKYAFDPKHTATTWTANHIGFSNPSGKFMGADGVLLFDELAPEKSSVDVTIKTDGLVSGLDDFNAHLKSKDFLNVAAFPTAHFVSTKVEKVGKNKLKVTGDLTLVGITKPWVLDVTVNKIGVQPMTLKKTAGFSAKGVIKRSDYGITYALPHVSEEVKIDIEAEAGLMETPSPAK